MMTKEDQNQIIKDVWTRNLQKEKDIPADIGEIYKNWLLGKIQEASVQLNPLPPQDSEEEGNSNNEPSDKKEAS